MKRTQKILAAMLTLAMLLTLSACGSKSEAPQTEAPPSAGLANPMKEVTAEELTQAVGAGLHAPENAENVSFQTITTKDSVVGQMLFTLDGKEYTYRVTTAEMDITQLSGMYFTAATETHAQVSYAEGNFLTQGNSSVLYWVDVVPGVRYSLACAECEDPSVLLEIAEATFVPSQGDDSGDGHAEYPDLEGTWVDADGSTVELTATGEYTFRAVVGIFRLAEFTGTAALDTVSMNLTLTDPAGGELYAAFYLEEDGTACLNITESHWDLLESGTQFTGFVRQ